MFKFCQTDQNKDIMFRVIANKKVLMLSIKAEKKSKYIRNLKIYYDFFYKSAMISTPFLLISLCLENNTSRRNQ